jgi:ribosomal protein L29
MFLIRKKKLSFLDQNIKNLKLKQFNLKIGKKNNTTKLKGLI